MPEWVRGILKWAGAIAVMGLVVVLAVPRALDALSEAIVFGEQEPELEPDLAPEEGATTADEDHLHGSVRVRDGVVANVGLWTSSVPPEHDVLLAFEPHEAEVACMTDVELELVVEEVSGEPELLARPAAIEDFDGLAEDDPLAADAIIDTEPQTTAQASPDDELIRWSITDVYAAAVREAPTDDRVVIAVSLVPETEGEISLGTAAGPADVSPLLTYTILEDCPDDDPAET